MYNLFTAWFKVTSNITRKHDFSTKTRGIDFVTKSRFLFHYSLKINAQNVSFVTKFTLVDAMNK